MAEFAALFGPGAETKILDVGGTPFNWQLIDITSAVTLVNLGSLQPVPRSASATLTFVQGDGTRLPFRAGAFDIAYSNSVLEHLSTFEQQKRFASEASRTAAGLWVQTPARSFPVEPHYLTPLIHFLPRGWQRRLLRNFTAWGLLTRPSPARVDEIVREIRLVSYREMEELFPDCEIRRERFLLLTKSYTAVRGSDGVPRLTT